MSTTTTSLIPKADKYFEHGMNVMLIGLHGVGKTEDILRFCRANDIVLKYYSCSTLDPFTDLVGVPTPRYYDKKLGMYFTTPRHPIETDRVFGEDPDIIEALKMVRPHEIDTAELLFFDEFNRADDKTQNAVFEIIQFKSINGERLPNVKACWAAMNPPDGDYKVSDLDPALIDRFDVFIDIQPKPSVAYMAQTLPKPIAQALYSWWGEHNQARRGLDNYISPRRLMKIGQVFSATGDFRPALPKWISCDRQKLAALLDRAQADIDNRAAKDTGGKLGDGPNPRFTYEADWIADKRQTVSRYLSDMQEDFDTHRAVLGAIESKQGRTLGRDFAEILNALKPSILEGFIAQMNPGKLGMLKEAVGEIPSHRYGNVPNLRKQLGLS